ncbi:MAG: glycosyltransferase [Anaerolineaceae bacterium]|nr:glycosyltransferase [Anaerolineaceae bacterium]
MKVLLIADGRSPITLSWIESMREDNIEVYLASTYPCPRPENISGFYLMPVAFANFSHKNTGGTSPAGPTSAVQPPVSQKGLVSRFRGAFMQARYLLGPLTLPYYGFKLNRIANKIRPDAVHALRIPFEGMLGSLLSRRYPLAVSIWGNDLTLHARGSWLMGKLTTSTLHRADALAADAARDIRLGKLWGFAENKQTLVIPGNGGISLSDIRLIAEDGQARLNWLPQDHHIIINPRGFRPGSVRNDTFFKSIPLVLSKVPNTLFLCCSMSGQPEALEWIDQLKIEKNVVLLPTLKQSDLWPLFKRAEASVSVSQHDGTPNSLLEAMALGCFPIAGDIESVREWIVPGQNGILIDPGSPEQLANAILCSIGNESLRQQAAEENRQLIMTRAEKSVISAKLAAFYRQLMK